MPLSGENFHVTLGKELLMGKCNIKYFLNVNKYAYVFLIDSIRYFGVGYETKAKTKAKKKRKTN